MSRVRATTEEPCDWCDEPVRDDEPYEELPHVGGESVTWHRRHYACLIRSVVGGINHQLGLCTCCGGKLTPDDPRLSKRDSARNAAVYFALRQKKDPAG